MRISSSLLALALATGVVSCGGTSARPGETAKPGMAPSAGVDSSPAPVVGQTGTQRSVTAGVPKDAEYSLFCEIYRGPDHVIQSKAIKDELIRLTGLQNWHIVHNEENSTLYYGFYRTFDDRKNDPQEVARAKADLARVGAIKSSNGAKLFKSCIFASLNDTDPDAPPQWNLTKLPKEAYWSLQIMAFYGKPERKQFAVEYVRLLRSKGVEGYYFHGETISSVCIGAWPIDAVQTQEDDAGRTKTPTGIPVVVDGAIPKKMLAEDLKDRNGNPVMVSAKKLEINSASMKQAIADFPQHGINGEILGKKTKEGKLVADPSFLVLVPHPATETLAIQQGGQLSAPVDKSLNDAANAFIDPPTPGASKLRSFGDK